MATYNWGFDHPFKAAIDLSDYQYYFVKSGSVEGEVTLMNVAGGSPLGVLQNDPVAGEEATVRLLGTSKVRADSGSAFTYGQYCKAGSDGAALGTITATAASAHVAGIVLQTPGTTGCGYAEILLIPATRYQ